MQISGEHHAGRGVLLAVAWEACVGHQADDVVAVTVHESRGLLVIAGKEHLGASPHAQHGLMLVEGLGGEVHRLTEQELEEIGKYRGIETD